MGGLLTPQGQRLVEVGPPGGAAQLLLGWAGEEVPYLLTPEGVFSYREMAERALRFAGTLGRWGLEPGDRLVLAMGDRWEFVAAFWGALLAGVVAVPVAPAYAAPELRFVFQDCQPKAVLHDATAARATVAAAEGLPLRRVSLEGELSQLFAAPEAEPRRCASEDLALLLYTSGTTGRMKGVMHTHGNLLAAAQGLPRALHLSPEDVFFSAARMFFAYGLGNSVYLPAAVGASVVVHPGPLLPGVVREVWQDARPTVFFAVPSLYSALLPGLNRQDRGRLRLAVSAGEKLPEGLWQTFTATLGVPLLDGLGMTETLHHITTNVPGESVPGSAGSPLPGFTLKVTGPGGEELPEGEAGELWVRGPTLMRGYWGQPQRTAQVLQKGWLRTADVVRISGGRVFHLGRRDELLKVGGLAVAPGEIEEVLRQHPAVAEAAVVPWNRGTGVVILKAFVVLQKGAVVGEEELLRHCRRSLARFKVPRLFEFVPELPRTLTGKLRRFLLRAVVAQQPPAGPC